MKGNAQLIRIISQEIAQHGPVSFAWFMGQALYHPAHGYYSSGKARIGRAGDFFTNVSVGPLFGRLLASQFVEMWESLGKPPDFTLVEQGANNGDFAADVLEALRETELFAALEYRIIEPIPALREQQAARLAGLGQVQWRANLEELAPFSGVHFSNELLDAMPVHLVRLCEGIWRERLVDWQDEAFVFVDSPAEIAPELVPFAPGSTPALGSGGSPVRTYQTEVNRAGLQWVEQIASKLIAGFILTIDYGYPREEFYHPERSEGTLTCYSNHRPSADPLDNVGQADITAHVEFTSIIEQACSLGMSVCGFTDQHRFMVSLAKPYLESMNPKELRAFRTLMHPAFMGSAFKVLALQKGNADRLRGFGP